MTRWTVQPVTVSPAASTPRGCRGPCILGSSEGWILTIRPAQRATKSAGRIRMKPASAIDVDRVVVEALRRAPVEARAASLASRSVQIGNALGLGDFEAGGLGLVAGDQRDFVRAVVGARGVDQRRHVRAAARNQDRDARARSAMMGRRPGFARAPRSGRCRCTVQPRWPASILPMRSTVSPAASSAAVTCGDVTLARRSRPCRCRS